MFVVTVDFEIAPDSVDSFIALVKENAALSISQEPDCHVFDVCVGIDDTSKIFLYEIYETEAAFQLHLKSAHFIDFDSKVKNVVKSKAVIVYNKVG